MKTSSLAAAKAHYETVVARLSSGHPVYVVAHRAPESKIDKRLN